MTKSQKPESLFPTYHVSSFLQPMDLADPKLKTISQLAFKTVSMQKKINKLLVYHNFNLASGVIKGRIRRIKSKYCLKLLPSNAENIKFLAFSYPN